MNELEAKSELAKLCGTIGFIQELTAKEQIEDSAIPSKAKLQVLQEYVLKIELPQI